MAINSFIGGRITRRVIESKRGGRDTRAALPLMMLSIVFSCAGSKPESTKIGGADGSSSILIASRSSQFKQTLIDRLIDDYKERAELKVIPLGEIYDVRTTDYDVLIVMGARMGWLMFSAKERRFLRRFKEPEKLIMLMTALDDDWEWNRDDIDIISGASKSANVDPIYQEVTLRLDALLEK